ncbi:AraC family transcriptional regulator [Anaerotalea alkaliphila]|uniref:AraC family transcriptional regulator n=1 Tax=Anaerotalea alkaliphila TaxID=2662126 RepID=A0A7X5KN54_9FIRM|nr:AraC family transcriptional regulator [Anaerotalea alkaliphila]NDL66437.1 AraC family transcriptional regulator [Anaerotalea alkaliphila]
MQSVDPGVLTRSVCFSFTPSETAKELYYYPVWCGHYFCNQHYFMKREYYPYLLLVFVRKGEFYIEYRGKKMTARKGDVFLIDCREPHFYQASDGLEFLYVHFDGVNSHDLCAHIMNTNGILFQGEHLLSLGKMLNDMIETYQGGGSFAPLEFSSFLYRMLAILVERPLEPHAEPTPVDRAIQYIRENVGEKITLDDLARLTNLSIYYFSHIFKAQTGYSPMEYVISTRLDRAKVLLKSTSLSIAEIAGEIGYANSGSFINLFVQKTGMSPTQFRKAPI